MIGARVVVLEVENGVKTLLLTGGQKLCFEDFRTYVYVSGHWVPTSEHFVLGCVLSEISRTQGFVEAKFIDEEEGLTVKVAGYLVPCSRRKRNRKVNQRVNQKKEKKRRPLTAREVIASLVGLGRAFNLDR